MASVVGVGEHVPKRSYGDGWVERYPPGMHSGGGIGHLLPSRPMKYPVAQVSSSSSHVSCLLCSEDEPLVDSGSQSRPLTSKTLIAEPLCDDTSGDQSLSDSVESMSASSEVFSLWLVVVVNPQFGGLATSSGAGGHGGASLEVAESLVSRYRSLRKDVAFARVKVRRRWVYRPPDLRYCGKREVRVGSHPADAEKATHIILVLYVGVLHGRTR